MAKIENLNQHQSTKPPSSERIANAPRFFHMAYLIVVAIE
jgi:hypothetical protein